MDSDLRIILEKVGNSTNPRSYITERLSEAEAYSTIVWLVMEVAKLRKELQNG